MVRRQVWHYLLFTFFRPLPLFDQFCLCSSISGRICIAPWQHGGPLKVMPHLTAHPARNLTLRFQFCNNCLPSLRPPGVSITCFAATPRPVSVGSSPRGRYRTVYNLTWSVGSFAPVQHVSIDYRVARVRTEALKFMLAFSVLTQR